MNSQLIGYSINPIEKTYKNNNSIGYNQTKNNIGGALKVVTLFSCLALLFICLFSS